MMAGEKILIIEDNPMNMELFSDLLEAEGYSVLKATEGKDGLGIAKSERPDLVLLDPGLPDVEGIEIIKEFKQDSKTKDIILIVCSASVMKEEKQQMFDAGCDGFIVKPIDTREFAKTIASYLQDFRKGGR